MCEHQYEIDLCFSIAVSFGGHGLDFGFIGYKSNLVIDAAYKRWGSLSELS